VANKQQLNSYTTPEQWFEDLKKEVLKVDPVSFAENYLTIDGEPLKLGGGTGWKFLADVYRYIATEALGPTGKPVVCVKGRQVGATVMATALELYFCASGMYGTSSDSPPVRILHCFPALANVQFFAKDKLSTMMRTSQNGYIQNQLLMYDEDGRRRKDVPEDTLTAKTFKNENKLWVESNANNAVRLQGMTLDGIFYDEVQRMNQDDIGNSRRTLTAARYGPVNQGIQLYFGTPLQKGSHFYKMWEASDQRYYHLQCLDCEHYFPLFMMGSNDWDKMWLYGQTIECPKCGFHNDKVASVESGKWIPTKHKMDNGEEPQYVGFHFNQMLIPRMTREALEKEKPGIHATNTERIWANEVLGEFYSGSDLPMSEEEIRQYCRDIDRRISFGAPPSRRMINRKIIGTYETPYFLGVDWGGKADSPDSTGGKSFSSVVVASADKAGTLHIENAFKLKSNDFRHKKEVVHEMFRRFDIKVGVADLGFGNDIVPELQREYGGRIIGCLNSGSLVNPYKYDPEELRMICNSHVVLDELFTTMRKSKVKFPWESYEHIHWLIEHCCSMEKEVRTHQGRVVIRYVKGGTPNDGLMALMYAYLGFKFYQTKGFAIPKHRLTGKREGPVLAHLPKF